MMLTFAHFWGIDEIGVFVLPAALALIALRWAERKARARIEEEERVGTDDD
jgi:NADH:ubiquinone oxidoreductase subunit H